MFFDDEDLVTRKSSRLKALPLIPATGWKAPKEFPNLSAATAIGVDLETFDPELLQAGPGWARHRGHIVGASIAATDARGNIGSWYFPMRHEVQPGDNLDAGNTLKWLKFVLENSLPKVGANLLYDAGWLTEENIELKGPMYDVQFAEALLDEEAFVALDVLARKYLGECKITSTLYDWIRQAYSPNETQIRAEIYRSPPSLVGPYAEADAYLPLRIIPTHLRMLSEEQLTDIFRMECDLIPLLIKMRLEGVSVDTSKAEAMRADLIKETIQLYARVESEFGYRLNIEGKKTGCTNANLQKLFGHLGLAHTGNFEKEWLGALEHPIGELINNIREHEKIVGTFIDNYILKKSINGKLYPQFHPLKGDTNGTLVGRFASSDPNLQNIPSRTKLGKRVRQAFVPDAGHSHWQKNDYSQIHYRILAHYAVDGNIKADDFKRILEFWNNRLGLWGGNGSADALRKQYIDNPDTDYHRAVYDKVAPLLGWSLTDEDEIKIKRRPIKNVNFGLLYGQTEKSLAYKAGFSGQQAKDFFKSYHEGAPYVKSTMKAIDYEVQTFGCVRTVLGRKVRFNLWEPDNYQDREIPLPYEQALKRYGTKIRRAFGYRGVNYKFQGSEPDIMKTGMLKCYHSGVFDYTGVPRLTVHDELDFSVRDNSPQMQEAFKFIHHTMQTAVPLNIPVKVDVTKGPNWGLAD
jgi:DNA polymerase-1